MLEQTVPATALLGVYVHVPFCAKRCYYCAFATAPLDDARVMARYVAAVLAEVDLVAGVSWTDTVRIGSVFLGGGTPSLLAPAALGAILDRVRRRFRLVAEPEVTVECNPESATRDALAAYRDAGVNRVSLGVQSLDDGLLARLGRLHDAAGARRAFDAARGAGFTNVSVDLMYGLPGLDAARWRTTVEGVLDWEPEHLSAYGLSLDAGSVWGARGIAGLPDEDDVVAQYWALARAAGARGFEHYEISNYARPGFRADHNVGYWRRGEYLAFGPAAAGFVGDVRYTNVRATPRYCAEVETGRAPVDGVERLDAAQARGERLILGLRLSDGVPAAWLDARVAGDHALASRLEAWQARGLLARDADRARLTEAGFLLSDALFVDLLDGSARRGAP